MYLKVSKYQKFFGSFPDIGNVVSLDHFSFVLIIKISLSEKRQRKCFQLQYNKTSKTFFYQSICPNMISVSLDWSSVKPDDDLDYL